MQALTIIGALELPSAAMQTCRSLFNLPLEYARLGTRYWQVYGCKRPDEQQIDASFRCNACISVYQAQWPGIDQVIATRCRAAADQPCIKAVDGQMYGFAASQSHASYSGRMGDGEFALIVAEPTLDFET